jgi:hypothetical protein
MVKPRTAGWLVAGVQAAGWSPACRRCSQRRIDPRGRPGPRSGNRIIRGDDGPTIGDMAPSPTSFFDQLFDRIGSALQPPGWVVEEMQRRLVLMLNHVLQQEPEAQARLKRQTGRLVEAHWRHFSVRLVATPAGLLDIGPVTQLPDLTLTLAEDRPSRWRKPRCVAKSRRCASPATCSWPPKCSGWSTTCAGTSRKTSPACSAMPRPMPRAR